MGHAKHKAIIKVLTEEGKYLLREIHGLKEGDIVEGYYHRNGAFDFKHNGQDAVVWIGINAELLK